MSGTLYDCDLSSIREFERLTHVWASLCIFLVCDGRARVVCAIQLRHQTL